MKDDPNRPASTGAFGYKYHAKAQSHSRENYLYEIICNFKQAPQYDQTCHTSPVPLDEPGSDHREQCGQVVQREGKHVSGLVGQWVAEAAWTEWTKKGSSRIMDGMDAAGKSNLRGVLARRTAVLER